MDFFAGRYFSQPRACPFCPSLYTLSGHANHVLGRAQNVAFPYSPLHRQLSMGTNNNRQVNEPNDPSEEDSEGGREGRPTHERQSFVRDNNPELVPTALSEKYGAYLPLARPGDPEDDRPVHPEFGAKQTPLSLATPLFMTDVTRRKRRHGMIGRSVVDGFDRQASSTGQVILGLPPSLCAKFQPFVFSSLK